MRGRSVWCGTTVTLAVTIAIVGGLRAAVREPVRTDTGLLSGLPAAAPGVRVFKGIPYAAPPVGELRWREPQPMATGTGIRKADTFGNACVQPKGVGRLNVAVDLPDSPPAVEDCLYLNVWTAAQSASERRSVMFCIVGEGTLRR
jgi:para-nitrobenzyl esterase